MKSDKACLIGATLYRKADMNASYQLQHVALNAFSNKKSSYRKLLERAIHVVEISKTSSLKSNYCTVISAYRCEGSSKIHNEDKTRLPVHIFEITNLQVI